MIIKLGVFKCLCRVVIIITHSAVIMCLQCYITNTPFNEMMRFKTDNTSIIEINSELLVYLQ
ncbi:histidine phosphatase family protein [Haloimpatiens massiliensis]|uniref:histidine phosphatase family protein n=1 Tax=Haloimpatiens massiliensis TaxID=1658110 RepID=UPI0011AF7734|nr:histidine phosphatase family protein [Haloimpatiens massiliensis]